MSGVVYRFYAADGALLYIGSTGHWPTRMADHQSRPWFGEVTTCTLEHHASIGVARTAETAAIFAEHPRYATTPVKSTARAWAARRDRDAAAHAVDAFCGRAGCRVCGLRRAEATYSEKVGTDLRSDVHGLRKQGHGRWAVASTISRRLGVSMYGTNGVRFTVGMVELIEHTRASSSEASSPGVSA